MTKECSQDHIQKEMSFLGFGNYRVTAEGTFIQCDMEARKIFCIPEDQEDLSGYSIMEFYVVPSERDTRLKELEENSCKPSRDVLSMRINGEYKNLFDVCWCCSQDGKKCYVGMVTEIEACTLSPEMFAKFPVGLYEVDDTGKIVHANKKLIKMLKYENEDQLLGKNFSDLCKDPKAQIEINIEIGQKGYANKILNLKDANSNIIKVECFSQAISEKEQLGMLTNVTKREQYYNAMENMPTGYFHIENDRITHCNEHFIRLMGYGGKENAIGKRTEEFFIVPGAFEQYMQDLRDADRRAEPLQNYEVLSKKRNSNQIVTFSVDSQIVRDEDGNEIGREGTIRDVSEKVKLKAEVDKAKKDFEKTTADINNLIHTFLHPVVKFSGNAELQHQMGKVLHQTMKPKITSGVEEQLDIRQLGEKLLNRIVKIINLVPNSNDPLPYSQLVIKSSEKEPIEITLLDFKKRLRKISYIFDYSLKSLDSDILLNGAIRDTVLRLLEELKRYDFSNIDALRLAISSELLEFLQHILLNYLTNGAKLLMDESEIMKRKVEALRSYIGLKKERTFSFDNYDISTILEENLERFRPVFLEKKIDIAYKKSGNLTALISPHDIDRIICNLLHNASKYSYHQKGRFVKVRARELGDRNKVEISIESFGIPIKQEEIRSGAILEFGYRGELAYASDRDGTGVGLADCNDILKAHNGTINITSRPAKVGIDPFPQKYNVPYLTKVIIRIPQSRKEKKKE